jgi:hypothetical protein
VQLATRPVYAASLPVPAASEYRGRFFSDSASSTLAARTSRLGIDRGNHEEAAQNVCYGAHCSSFNQLLSVFRTYNQNGITNCDEMKTPPERPFAFFMSMSDIEILRQLAAMGNLRSFAVVIAWVGQRVDKCSELLTHIPHSIRSTIFLR